jgi:hypothetical protein
MTAEKGRMATPQIGLLIERFSVASGAMKKLWLACAGLVLAHAAVVWAGFLREHELTRPRSPIDIAQPQYASYWRFLASAKRVVPPGATYTVKGQTLLDEMDLFAISLDVLTQARAMPSSYLSQPLPDGDQAKYVLVHGSGQCPPDATVMRPVDGGSVCIREHIQ